MIWSDEQTASPGSSAPSLATTRSAPAASATTLSSGGGFATEEVRQLVVRYLQHRASATGPAHHLRQEISPLVLAIERGVDVRGWGHALVRALERAGDFQLDWHIRTVNYWIKGFKDDGIVARPIAGSRAVEFPFGEFGNLNSLAVARLYRWAGLTPPSAATHPPIPPTAPPPSAPSSGSPPSPPPNTGRFGAAVCNTDSPRPPPAAPAAAPFVSPTLAAPTVPSEPIAKGVTGLQWADLLNAPIENDGNNASSGVDAEPWPEELKPEFMFYTPPELRSADGYVSQGVDDSVRRLPKDAEVDEEIDDAARGPPDRQ